MRVEWTDTALVNLAAIHDYIAQHSPQYALAMVARITDKSKLLRQFPLIGANVPEYRDDQIREVLVYPYRLIYRACEDRVEILAVVHGARQLPDKLS